ncbi:MAG: lipid-A-disaccharide synthase, partial [Candidatus Riflebacteria bacterium]|nr:lipid-A-disaccharide synthase [Candidatus Riflebacteria bacterium]
MSPRVFISAGEASGDRHAANLARCLRELNPEVRLVGMGGDRMREAGVDVQVDIRGLG